MGNYTAGLAAVRRGVNAGCSKLGGFVTRTALAGAGPGLVQHLHRSVSLLDLGQGAASQDQPGQTASKLPGPCLSKQYRSEEFLNRPNPNYSELRR